MYTYEHVDIVDLKVYGKCLQHQVCIQTSIETHVDLQKIDRNIVCMPWRFLGSVVVRDRFDTECI